MLYCPPFDQCIEPFGNPEAGIAQLVEHHVANVDVASSSLVSRSKFLSKTRQLTPWRKAQADREARCALLGPPIFDFKSVLFFGVQTVLQNETLLRRYINRHPVRLNRDMPSHTPVKLVMAVIDG